MPILDLQRHYENICLRIRSILSNQLLLEIQNSLWNRIPKYAHRIAWTPMIIEILNIPIRRIAISRCTCQPHTGFVYILLWNDWLHFFCFSFLYARELFRAHCISIQFVRCGFDIPWMEHLEPHRMQLPACQFCCLCIHIISSKKLEISYHRISQ